MLVAALPAGFSTALSLERLPVIMYRLLQRGPSCGCSQVLATHCKSLPGQAAPRKVHAALPPGTVWRVAAASSRCLQGQLRGERYRLGALQPGAPAPGQRPVLACRQEGG
jgi:hypothetical protein